MAARRHQEISAHMGVRQDQVSWQINPRRAYRILIAARCGAIVFAVLFMAKSSHGQATSLQAGAVSGQVEKDDLQRSYRIDHYLEVADSGASRGENIYFFKYWMCHNQYAQAAPYLKDLYQHQTLMSGLPVNDDTVTEQIKNGGPGMPAFGASLSDSDIADMRVA
jgi:cytochrome c5